MTKPYSELSAGSISSWQVADRPREKLADKGAAVLSLAELLALVMRSGNATESAIGLARSILITVDYDLHKLALWTAVDYCKFKGVGMAKAGALVAALELGRRRASQRAREQTKFCNSEACYAYFRPLIGDILHEEFWILLLNQGHTLLGAHLISKGGVTGTVADARLIFKRALETSSCTSIILAHNHPSGQAFPSGADRQLTQKLSEGARLLDLVIMDHLIITQQSYYSFADEGDL